MDLSRHAKPIAMSLLGLGLIAVATAIVLSSREPSSSAAPAASSPLSVVNGVTMIRVDVATQQRSGIVIQPLVAATHRGETMVYGQVLDLQPLIELRNRHDAAQAELIAARAAAAASRAEAERSRALYEDQRNVSLKAYQAAQASDRADQAKAEAAELNVRNVEASARQQFGQTLAGAAFDPHSSAFSRLLARQDVLVRVTLPAAGAQASSEIEVQASGGARSPGLLVSPAAQADPGLAGNSFLYRVPAPLPTGASVVAYLPTSSQPAQGVFVPSSAVVWYAGQPWVYVQDSAARFARRPLGHVAEADGGYFTSEGLKPGERVVTSGAGLLLSEEQRPPRSGAGCKDPECD